MAIQWENVKYNIWGNLFLIIKMQKHKWSTLSSDLRVKIGLDMILTGSPRQTFVHVYLSLQKEKSRTQESSIQAVSSKASLDWYSIWEVQRVMWPITNTAQINTHNCVYRLTRIKGADFTLNHTLRLYYDSNITTHIDHQLYILQECFLSIKNQIAITTPDARKQRRYDSVIYLHFQEKKALELCTNRLGNISFGQSLTHNIENPNVININT